MSLLGTVEYARHSILTSLLPPWYITENPDKIADMEKYLAGSDQPVEIMESRIDAICAFDRRDRMGDIDVPALVIVAEDDMVTPRYLSDQLAEASPVRKSHPADRWPLCPPRAGRRVQRRRRRFYQTSPHRLSPRR